MPRRTASFWVRQRFKARRQILVLAAMIEPLSQTPMNRRHFLEAVAAGMLASPLIAAVEPKGLPVRALGRTGIQVPILGFGSGSRFLMYKDEQKALEALSRALDSGIVYIDTAHS